MEQDYLEDVMLNAPEMVILLVAVILFKGGKNLPELGRGLGQGIKEFNRAIAGNKTTEEQKQIEK